MQISFSHIIGFNVGSYSTRYLTHGDYISFYEKLKRENKVIATVKKWKWKPVLVEIVEAAMQYYTISSSWHPEFSMFCRKISFACMEAA